MNGPEWENLRCLRGDNERGDVMNKKVLTIDDSKTLRMIIGKHLAPFGVHMMQAENGAEGIARAREAAPDVILLDYNMPVMDGYHTLIELKADPDLKGIPVVMLTTETVKETVIKLMKLGLKDYIAKPFTRELLLQKLNPILDLYSGSDTPQDNPFQGKNDKITVLAVDDKANILEMLKEYIGAQCNLITVDSGKAALNAVETNYFDYMFLDLSMPEVDGFDVLKAYLQNKRKGISVKNVVAMTLRTAKIDIERAMGMGVGLLLHKPFSREDTGKIMERLILRKKEETSTKTSFLTVKDGVRILDCPSENSPDFRAVAGALSGTIVHEIDDMAEEGLSRLVIKVGEGFLSDLGITRKFVNMIEHIIRLSLTVRLVADSDQAREALQQFSETARLPVDESVDSALGAIR
jgi:two-component system, cell cycle response regulator